MRSPADRVCKTAGARQREETKLRAGRAGGPCRAQLALAGCSTYNMVPVEMDNRPGPANARKGAPLDAYIALLSSRHMGMCLLVSVLEWRLTPFNAGDKWVVW